MLQRRCKGGLGVPCAAAWLTCCKYSRCQGRCSCSVGLPRAILFDGFCCVCCRCVCVCCFVFFLLGALRGITVPWTSSAPGLHVQELGAPIWGRLHVGSVLFVGAVCAVCVVVAFGLVLSFCWYGILQVSIRKLCRFGPSCKGYAAAGRGVPAV